LGQIKTLLEGELKVKDASGPLTIDGTVAVSSLPATPAGTNNIGDVDVVGGTIAHDGADSGNPIKTGGRARTEMPAAVAQNDRADVMMDKFGRQLLTPFPLDSRVEGRLTLENNTSTTIIATPGSGLIFVVTDILVINAHATVATRVEILEEATARVIGYAEFKGGGWQQTNSFGIFKTAGNVPIKVKCETTGSKVDVFVGGFKTPA
jgi:hypothetical protein